MAHERDVELLDGLKLDRMGECAAGTTKVLEDDDGDLAASGRAQDGGVKKVVMRSWADELGAHGRCGEAGCDEHKRNKGQPAHGS